MSLITWKKEFSVGVAEVDFEHRELIELINSLHDSARPGEGRDAVIESLGEIFDQIASLNARSTKITCSNARMIKPASVTNAKVRSRRLQSSAEPSGRRLHGVARARTRSG